VSARVELTPQAEEDLADYLAYVLEQSRDVRVMDRQSLRVLEALARLATLPRIGRRARGADLRPGTRAFPLRDTPLQALYEVPDDGIRVLQLRHSRRDAP